MALKRTSSPQKPSHRHTTPAALTRKIFKININFILFFYVSFHLLHSIPIIKKSQMISLVWRHTLNPKTRDLNLACATADGGVLQTLVYRQRHRPAGLSVPLALNPPVNPLRCQPPSHSAWETSFLTTVLCSVVNKTDYLPKSYKLVSTCSCFLRLNENVILLFLFDHFDSDVSTWAQSWPHISAPQQGVMFTHHTGAAAFKWVPLGVSLAQSSPWPLADPEPNMPVEGLSFPACPSLPYGWHYSC